MLYSEFVEGTGCRENDHNYKVYKDLEVMYMNSDMSKQEVYEYGKKLVDNSKSPEQLTLEEEVKAEMTSLREELRKHRADAKRYDEYYKQDKADTYWKAQRDWSRECAKDVRRRINGLKWLLEV